MPSLAQRIKEYNIKDQGANNPGARSTKILERSMMENSKKEGGAREKIREQGKKNKRIKGQNIETWKGAGSVEENCKTGKERHTIRLPLQITMTALIDNAVYYYNRRAWRRR